MSDSIWNENCLIGMGTNIGDRSQQLSDAIDQLQSRAGIELVAKSDWFQTKPLGGPHDQDYFLNGAALFRSNLSAEAFHGALLETETQLGRKRTERWGPRKIDLDLLLFGSSQVKSPILQIPHPRMSFRKFVLDPCCQIAGDLIDPNTGASISHYLNVLNSPSNLIVVDGLCSDSLLTWLDDRKINELISESDSEIQMFVVQSQPTSTDSCSSRSVSNSNLDRDSPFVAISASEADSIVNLPSSDSAIPLVVTTKDDYRQSDLSQHACSLLTTVSSTRSQNQCTDNDSRNGLSRCPYLDLTAIDPSEWPREVAAAMIGIWEASNDETNLPS